MTVTLELNVESPDITELLDDEADIDLGQEHELKMFQRTVDDIRLRCSNLHGEFTDWLVSPSSVKPRIKIKDGGRVLFRGEIQQPLSFDINGEWVSFDCFSMTKTFWDRCKQTRISKAVPVGQEDLLFTTVQAILERELTPERFGDLFVGFQIADIYIDREIRFWGYTADETIGNNGRYKDLDPRTTIDELLKAMTMYYNADIFIDPATQLLVMQKRDEILNDVNHQLDGQVDEDEEFAVEIYDEKFVYISLTLNLGRPTAPSYIRTEEEFGGRGLGSGSYKWAVSFLYRGSGLTAESMLGEESETKSLHISKGNRSQDRVVLLIPAGPPGCVGRKIYRTRNSGIGTLYLAGTVDDNTSTSFADSTPDAELTLPAPRAAANGTIWLRYDEEAGSYDDVIIGDDAGLNAPFGETFDVTPHLRFLGKPYGYGYKIVAIYPGPLGRTRIRTGENIEFEAGLGIRISQTNCVPSLDGDYNIYQVLDEFGGQSSLAKVIFEVIGPVVTTPGTDGLMMPFSDINKEPPLDTASENIVDVFAFFGNERDKIEELQDQWINLFRSRKRIKLTAKGLAYQVGDSASLNRKYNGHTIGKCVVKKATNSLMNERTKLELLTI